MKSLTRRQTLQHLLLGPSLLALRSLASGLPASVLLNPRRALAADPLSKSMLAASTAPQFIIFNASVAGDPLSCNVPGTYDDAAIMHPADPIMAPTPMMIQGGRFIAAAPWTTLSSDFVNRLGFFHQATNTSVHNEKLVLGLSGRILNGDMLVSRLSFYLAPRLMTKINTPMSVSTEPAEAFFAQGWPQPQLTPTALKAVLPGSQGLFDKLAQLRDRDLNRVNEVLKRGNPGPRSAFLDRFATSIEQARAIGEQVPASIETIGDDGPRSQITAALVLMQLRVTPVVGVHLPFGGDNHSDSALAAETRETVAGVQLLGFLEEQLKATKLWDKVTFASLNAFGRTLRDNGRNGRDHNESHHVGLIMGGGVRGGVYGGVARLGNDYGALPVNARSGAGSPDGDIAREDTLAAFALTLAAATGVDVGAFSKELTTTTGKVITAAMTSA